VQSIADAITPKTKTPKANTSKPRTTATKPKAATGAGVVKAKKPRTKTEKVVDTIVGKGEKGGGGCRGEAREEGTLHSYELQEREGLSRSYSEGTTGWIS
jgi:hypothetical protein